MARIFALALATVAMGALLPAKADEALSQVTTADVRCIIVASVMGNEEANAHSAALLALYFLGRIDGREPPSFDLSKAMVAQISLMSTTDFNSEGKRCGKELEGRGTYLAEVGHKLTQLSTEQKQ
jgi:hypothetical protein